MVRKRSFRHGMPIVLWATAVLAGATTGNSQPESPVATAHTKDRRACKIARINARELEQTGHLRQARDVWLSCAKATCTGLLRQECANRYTQIASDIPTIVPLVTDQTGAPRVDVQVRMDGEVLTTQLDGRALLVDPGLHEFSFSVEGGAVITQRIMIVEGHRNQPISVSLTAQDKRAQRRTLAPSVALPPSADAKTATEKPPLDARPAEEPSEKPVPEKAVPDKATADKAVPDKTTDEPPVETAPEPEVRKKSGPGAFPYLLSGVGLVGAGGGALLTYWGRKDNQLLLRCAPDCAKASVDHVRKLYLESDIALGAGGALLVTGVLWLALGSRANTEKPPTQAYSFDVQPMRSGAFATVSGAF